MVAILIVLHFGVLLAAFFLVSRGWLLSGALLVLVVLFALLADAAYFSFVLVR